MIARFNAAVRLSGPVAARTNALSAAARFPRSSRTSPNVLGLVVLANRRIRQRQILLRVHPITVGGRRLRKQRNRFLILPRPQQLMPIVLRKARSTSNRHEDQGSG